MKKTTPLFGQLYRNFTRARSTKPSHLPEAPAPSHSSGHPALRRLEKYFPGRRAEPSRSAAFGQTSQGYQASCGVSDLALEFPKRGSEPLSLTFADGFRCAFRECGVRGEARLLDTSLCYERSDGHSLWNPSPRGFQEWLLLEDNVPCLMILWRLKNGTFDQDEERVRILDPAGAARVALSIPAAFDATGQAQATRLEANGSQLALYLAASGREPQFPLLVEVVMARAPPTLPSLRTHRLWRSHVAPGVPPEQMPLE